MTVGSGEQGKPAMNKEAGAAGAPDGAVGSESGGTSPFRLLLVIVPLVVIVVVSTNLMGLWTTSFQQAAREERLRQIEPRPQDEEAVDTPSPIDDDPASMGVPSAAGEDAPAETDAAFDATVVVALLADANPEHGASLFRLCLACHTGEKDAPVKIGPNLWGVVGRPKAAHPEYRYSAGLRAKGGTWSYEDLAAFLHDPRTFAPGTSMAFRGILEHQKLADLIAYMRTLSDTPPPLPN